MNLSAGLPGNHHVAGGGRRSSTVGCGCRLPWCSPPMRVEAIVSPWPSSQKKEKAARLARRRPQGESVSEGTEMHLKPKVASASIDDQRGLYAKAPPGGNPRRGDDVRRWPVARARSRDAWRVSRYGDAVAVVVACSTLPCLSLATMLVMMRRGDGAARCWRPAAALPPKLPAALGPSPCGDARCRRDARAVVAVVVGPRCEGDPEPASEASDRRGLKSQPFGAHRQERFERACYMGGE